MEERDEERYVQIGVTALRGPDGTFLPAVPLYAEATEATEAQMYAEIGKYFKRAFDEEVRKNIPNKGKRKRGRT